jgi:HAD superfamily hydrolase (TIGR01509 family)
VRGGFTAVLFDMDGVLVDTEIWWDEVRIAFAARHGRTWTSDDRASVMGHNSAGWSRVMRDRLDLDLAPEVIEREVVDAVVARFATDPAPLIPGAIDTVRRLASRWPLGVASSAHPAVIAAALDATALHAAFRTVTSSDEVAHGKPAPDVYLLAARRMGVEPDGCLVVEDSLNGVLAGRAAGMTVVLVPNRSIPPAPGAADAANVTLASIEELDPEAIDVAVHSGRAARPARRLATRR